MASSDMGPLVTWGGALWPSSLSGRGVKGALAPPLEQHSQPFCTLAFSSGVCGGGGSGQAGLRVIGTIPQMMQSSTPKDLEPW